jgi:hypothetical protein
MCGTSNAIANAVYACCGIISDFSCNKRAREHSKHKGVALDPSLYRVVKHGILILFCLEILFRSL